MCAYSWRQKGKAMAYAYCVCAGQPASLSRKVLPLINRKGQTSDPIVNLWAFLHPAGKSLWRN